MVPKAIGAVIFAAMAVAAMRCEAQTVAEPEHYRTDDYRAPTPATLRGARVITTAEAEAIWRAGAASFVDVMPHVSRPPELPPATIWREKRRSNIPVSVWLADTGYGELSPAAEAHLKAGLERITAGDRSRPVVIYCVRDCWMSWNAAKRAVAAGYAAVAWYPEGTDGWQDAGLPLIEARPEARPAE